MEYRYFGIVSRKTIPKFGKTGLVQTVLELICQPNQQSFNVKIQATRRLLSFETRTQRACTSHVSLLIHQLDISGLNDFKVAAHTSFDN